MRTTSVGLVWFSPMRAPGIAEDRGGGEVTANAGNGAGDGDGQAGDRDPLECDGPAPDGIQS